MTPRALIQAVALVIGPLACGPAAAAPAVETSGSLRLRWEGSDGAPFGPAGPPPQTVLMTRALVDVRVGDDDGARVFAQLAWHDVRDREGGRLPTDAGGLDVQRVVLDLPVADRARLRLGRQELVLGSARLVGVRDSPNIRRSFDGALLETPLGPEASGWRLRAFAFETVENRPGAFDDRSDDRATLAGVEARRAPTPGRPLGLDVALLKVDRVRVFHGAGTGPETRWTASARLYGRSGPFDWNVEPMAQWGAFRDQDIRAWTIASDVGWRPAGAPMRTRFGLKANVTSGDSNRRDDVLGTFDPLFPNLAYFSEAATISPKNHMDLQIDVTSSPRDGLTLRAGLDVFARTRTSDAVHRADGSPAPGFDRTRARAVARQWDAELRWAIAPDAELRAGLVHWRPLAALAPSGAQPTTFALMQLTRRFGP